MSARAIFDGFYISGEPNYSSAGGKLRVDFSICSPKYFNGQMLKVYCCAFDEVATMIQRLKARRGSFVDIICEMIPYTREGKEGITYKILYFTYSAQSTGSSSSPTVTTNEAKTEKNESSAKDAALHKAANILANNPFA